MTYTVKKGDTLYGISNQYGVSVSDIVKLNNIDPNKLQIGQIINIPNKEGVNPNTTFNYTVKKGDTLYKIANNYSTTVSDIVNLNNLKNTNLSIGQILKIPENYNTNITLPNFKNYTVKKGDNLYSISKLNNISVDTIIKDNNLNSNLLNIGQVLKIRINDNNILECFGNNEEISNVTYIVKSGDNLYSIARKYNTTVDNIKKKNNLKTNLLSIGQKLII